jgi:hypothetical protein
VWLGALDDAAAISLGALDEAMDIPLEALDDATDIAASVSGTHPAASSLYMSGSLTCWYAKI